MNNITFTSNYDIIFLSIIILSSGLALIRGVVSEVLSLSVWFITFALIKRYGGMLDSWLPLAYITNGILRTLIIFVIIFIVVAIVIAIVKRLCNSFMGKIGLGGLNYLLGAIFGAVRGTLICALLVILIEVLKFDPTNSWQLAHLAVVIQPVVQWIKIIIVG